MTLFDMVPVHKKTTYCGRLLLLLHIEIASRRSQ